ncbi:MAG: hypothetical protein RL217_2066 [Pseudomonadota bacterium]|jgi:predicted DsbA family dithiol-disulfide isomerase
MKSIRIDIISDVMCPWCAIGLASLNKALQALEGQMQVDLHFQPFELNPAMPEEGQDMREHLIQKYGISAQESDKNRAMITERGAALGFEFRFVEGMRMRNTFKAHQLLHWAEDSGKQQTLKNSLFIAHFRDHKDISKDEDLLSIVQQIGLDAQEAKAVLADERFAHFVRDKEQQWQEMGIHSVPAFILNEKYLISGGQPPETFVEALTKVSQE